jgi:hypothetical protein
MKRIALPGAIGLLLALGLHVAPAQAQLARTFVSSLGNDANDCGRPTPCRTFQRAHDNTLGNGEITVLDPGGYGAATITKTISIINDGVGEAGALVSGGFTGITISAGVNDKVSPRGLTIKGIGFGGGNGIVFNSGKSLTVENCAIRNLTSVSGVALSGIGIQFVPNASSGLAVSNTLVADSSFHGILVAPSGSGTVNAVFSQVETYNNAGTGIFVKSSTNSTGTTNATVVDSVAANNGAGFSVESPFPLQPVARLLLDQSVAANNGTGVFSNGANAFALISRSTLSGNASGWLSTVVNTIRSYGNNNIDGNAASEAAPPAIALK